MPDIATPSVVIVGSCIIDVVAFTQRIPVDGDSLVSSNITIQVGGKASNQAIAIKRLGLEAKLIIRVGIDHWSNIAKELWINEGVDITYVTQDLSAPTGLGIVVVDNQGRNFTLSSLGSNSKLLSKHIEEANLAIVNAKVLTAHLNPPVETIQQALTIAKNNGVVTLLNISPVEPLPDHIFDLIDIVVLNHVEASLFLKRKVDNYNTASLAGREILSKGAKTVLISLGDQGVALVNSTGNYLIPAFKVAPIDTTGAGDALNAGVAVALAEGKDIYAAVHFACAVSAVSVSREGTWNSMPQRSEVDILLGKKDE